MINKIAIVGGGPAALMIYKRLVSGAQNLSIDIFETNGTLGRGMPYSSDGAEPEHLTNVSSDELPDLVTPLADWVIDLPASVLNEFGIERDDFHEKKVLPRLLFGRYLHEQFQTLIERGQRSGLKTHVHCDSAVVDIQDEPSLNKVLVRAKTGEVVSDATFDAVVICTGHHWPIHHEGKVPGYFDSPYPPAKLSARYDNQVVIRGSSLTAIDAIRTMSRCNGRFDWEGSRLIFRAHEQSQHFRVVMHSRQGLLPCIRVHMDEPHTAGSPVIPPEDIAENISNNDGFLELDFLFEHGFKRPLQESDPAFYEQIKDMDMETFVQSMMAMRQSMEPFALFKKEYKEASHSIQRERPVYWKERLAALSFAMNYPAKYLSAEDMLRLQKVLMPLISVVIAFVPQSSCQELMALHDANRLDIVADGGDGTVEVADDNTIVYHYNDDGGRPKQVVCQTFVDCTGQPHLSIGEFPFQKLVEQGVVSRARLKFRDQKQAEELLQQGDKNIEKMGNTYYLQVPGANISDCFQVVDRQGKASERIYLMAVPYMGGFNPDYSGLDFCEHASELIVDNLLKLTVAAA